MDLADRLGPVDLDLVVAAPALVGGVVVVLLAPGRLAVADEVDALDQRVDPDRIELVEVPAPERVVRGSSTSLVKSSGPVSRPSSGQKIETPVVASPWMIAQLIALGPRWRGRSDGWFWIVPCVGDVQDPLGGP